MLSRRTTSIASGPLSTRGKKLGCMDEQYFNPLSYRNTRGIPLIYYRDPLSKEKTVYRHHFDLTEHCDRKAGLFTRVKDLKFGHTCRPESQK